MRTFISRPTWFLPSLSDLLFVSLIVWLFVAGSGWMVLLADGDTGWHIRTGELILQTGSVPTQDVFSFSRPGQPWFAWEWLADLVFALLHRLWGLAGVVVLSAILIALTALILFRHMLWRGANPFVALLIVLLSVGASSIHYLARPHIFSLFFLALALWILDQDRRAPSPWVWILVALTAVWVNFHGGFVALLACIVLLALGSGIEARFRKNQALFRRYSLLSVACAAASLMNPYGIRLHVHIAKYLTSDWIRQAVDEFQSPKFRSENLLQFETLMFTALVIAGVLLMKKRIADVLPVLVWAHLALSSVRHVPIFVIVAAPFVASELTRVWNDWTQAASPRSALGILGTVARDLSGGFRRNSLWAPALAAAAIWLTPAAKWPQDFPELKFPVDLTRQHAERLAVARVFTSDEWGDYLIYRGWPRQKVFIDGRSDFYGPKIGKEFLQLAHGLPDWEKILKQYDFDLALIPRDWPLATLLQRQPGWRLVAHDSQALLFERSSSFAGLINRAVTADRSRGDPEDEGQQSGFTPSFIASPPGDNSGLENTSGREESRKLADSVRAGPGRVRSSHGFCGRAVAEVAELDPGADKVAAVESNIVKGTHGP